MCVLSARFGKGIVVWRYMCGQTGKGLACALCLSGRFGKEVIAANRMIISLICILRQDASHGTMTVSDVQQVQQQQQQQQEKQAGQGATGGKGTMLLSCKSINGLARPSACT